jgi:hypothetical protein
LIQQHHTLNFGTNLDQSKMIPSVKIEFCNIDVESQQKIMSHIQYTIQSLAFVNPPLDFLSRVEIFKDYIIANTVISNSIEKLDESIYSIPIYERAFDDIVTSTKEVISGSICKCFNCGRPDHSISNCKEARNHSEIEKNKLLFFETHPKKEQEDSRRYFDEPKRDLYPSHEHHKKKEGDRRDDRREDRYRSDHRDRDRYDDRYKNRSDDRYDDYRHEHRRYRRESRDPY